MSRTFQQLGVALIAMVFLTSACRKSRLESGQEGTEQATAPADQSPESNGQADEKAPPPAPAGPTGTIQGKVDFSGAAPEMKPLKRGSDVVCARTEAKQETVVVNGNGTLRNVVVRIQPETITGPMPQNPVVVEQTACMYRPRVSAAVAGQTLEIRNDDDTFHNIHARVLTLGTRQGSDTIFNRGQPPKGPALDQKVPKVDVVELKCDAHGWMKGFVVVSDNPYFAVTGDDGSFAIKGVPVGEYELQTWHELYGVKTTHVKVTEGEVTTVDFSYSASDAPSVN